MRLTAVVPATNAPATLERCLEAIHRAAEPPDEIVVVDNPKVGGPASARNEGALSATGDVLVFVDADVEVHPDAFTRIRAVFADDPDLTAVFGSYDDRPSAPGVVSVFRNLLHHHVHHMSAGPAGTFWAGLGAVRRDAFLSVGGFDADRFETPSVEDIDLGMRLSATGARILLDPTIQGTHLKAWTTWSMVRTDLVSRGIPWVGLLLRHRSASGVLNLGWRHRLSAGLSLAAVGSTALQHLLVALLVTAAFVALNGQFYALLLRRSGLRTLLTGVPLHLLHHLTAVVALPLGIALHLGSQRGPSGAESTAESA